MPLNSILIRNVKQALASKQAFVPPGGGAPPTGGAPPMDPAAMGGMSPGGAPPMDPAMLGGAPPMDPAMMGGAPPMDPAAMGGAPPMPPMDPSLMGGAPPAPPSGTDPAMIKQLIQEEIQKAMTGGGENGGKPKSKGSAKVDPAQLLEYMERQQKLLINLYESLGLSLPYNILDKPAAPEEGAEGGEGKQEAPPTASDISGISPIKPIEPIGGKQASLSEKAEAARHMLNALSRKR